MLESSGAVYLLLLLLLHLHLNLVHVVFKVSFLCGLVRESHLPVPVLDTSIPLSLVPRAVSPAHLTIAVSIVF